MHWPCHPHPSKLATKLGIHNIHLTRVWCSILLHTVKRGLKTATKCQEVQHIPILWTRWWVLVVSRPWHADSEDADQGACFICKDEDTARSPDLLSDYQCPICTSPIVSFDPKSGPAALAHIGAHILHDTRVSQSQQPCGLCLQPSPLCQWYLKCSASGIDGVAIDFGKSQCMNKMHFHYHPASISTKASPCSNVPLWCPLCYKLDCVAPAIWQYNFKAHLEDRHPATNPDHYKNLWNIRPSETHDLKQIYSKWGIVPRERNGKNKKLAAVRLKISEVQSMHQHFMMSSCRSHMLLPW